MLYPCYTMLQFLTVNTVIHTNADQVKTQPPNTKFTKSTDSI